MLTKEQKNRWVAALRSGQYKQCHRKLRGEDNNSYCCLGVLCDTIDAKAWNHFTTEKWAWKGQAGIPGIVQNGNSDDQTIEWQLTRMNDLERKSFSEIADWVELNVPTQENVE